MALLEVKHLVKRYGHKTVVNDVSLSVDPGQVVGLLGPNGAGKTTSFRMTVGMITPDGGSVFLDGDEVTHLPMYRRARRGLGYLSQEPSVFQRMSVLDNVIAIVEMLDVPPEEQREHSLGVLREFGLEQLADELAMHLSGGERRRLEIARALVTRPSVIMLDEPFSGVDPKKVSDIKGMIATMRDRGIGILLTDHNVRDTLSITDRAYIIDEGVILMHGTPDQVVADQAVRSRYLGDDFRM
ncbi:MAG: LPS export ABC transporter ATP-binding protein [Planctomycetota bacterium]